jgi:CubicO group peptidase (beta-lactamase class C family)
MNKQFFHRSTQFFILICIFNVLVAGCTHPAAVVTPAGAPTSASASSTYWPTQDWRTSTPEEQGMDAQKLAQMLLTVKKQALSLHSLLIIRHGYLVSETYFSSYTQDTRHELYSCTKSFIATLTGIAIDKGYIDGVSQRVVDFFPEVSFANLDQQKKDMTLEDLLTMRSGLDWQEGDATYSALVQSTDWVKFVLDEPMIYPPGSHFSYCSGCSHVLSAILQKTTGTTGRDFAEQYLFTPLGITNVRWDTDRAGAPIGGWGLQLTPREMAKLGYLYLHNGQWDGQQIVSAAWVADASQKHTPATGNLGYGYQWWTYPSLSAYTALGRYGQTIFVVPASDLVIVTTAFIENHDEIFNLIEEYIIPSIK